MGLIVRYILRELGVTFLFGYVVFTCLLLIVFLIQRAIEEHIPLTLVWQLIPFVFAEASYISLPVTLLLAVTIFFARMSGNNEVIALKALGVPPRAFLMPVFVIAFLVSLIGVGINELSITWGRKEINDMISRNAEEILIGQLRSNRRIETKDRQLTIVVQGVDEQSRLIEPTIMLNRVATMEARRAQVLIDFNTNMLTIILEDFRVAGGEGFQGILGDREFQLPLSEFVSIGESNRASDMGLYRINAERRNAAEQIEQQRRIIAAHRTFGAFMGSVDDWVAPQIWEAKARIRSLQSHIDRLSVEPPRRWANGFSSFFFVLLGAPLAIWMRRSDSFSSFFVCFVPILLLYYPLLTFGVNQAKNGTLPPICVWTANVGIGLIGLWFLRKIHRY